MHIAVIGSRSSIHIVRWVNALSDRGYEVTLFSMHEGQETINERVHVEKLPFRNPFGYVLNIPHLRFRLKDIHPDIVHSFYALGHGFLGRMSGVSPHIISVLGSDIFDDIHRNYLLKAITLKNIEKADVVCSTSKVMALEIKKYIDREIEITPFGIDIDKFSPNLERSKKADAHDFVIGTVKWLEEKYGVDTLIKAFSELCKRNPDVKFKLIIIGDGSEVGNLKRLAQKLGVIQNCDFVGRVEHTKVPFWLSKMDIYVALSRFDSESFGVAVLEASAMGLPVIVSNAGGLPEVVSHLKTGIIVAKENPIQAYKALERLYFDKNFSNELGKRGRAKVIDMYKWEDSLFKMEDIYGNLLQ